MKIYHYHPDTKEFTGEGLADADPLETRKTGSPAYLIPAFAVTAAPPETGAAQTVRYSEAEGKWLVEDLADPAAPLPLTLCKMKQNLKDRTKAEAHGRIEAIIPEWKQRNYLARGQELLGRKIDGTITADELAELDALMAIWARIKAIRAASNAIETAIEAMNTEAEAEAKDVSTDPAWPE